MEAYENHGYKLNPHEQIAYNTITSLCSNEIPYERTDSVSEEIGTSPNIDGVYVVHSYVTRKDLSEFDADPYVPDASEFNVGYLEDINELYPEYDGQKTPSYISRFYTPPPKKEVSELQKEMWHTSGQKLVIVPNEGEGELTLIDFKYDAIEGSVDLFINKDAMKRIETTSELFATDFVKHPILGEIFFEAANRDADAITFMRDEAAMWLFRASSNWPISEKMGITKLKYSVMSNDTICQVDCIQNLYEGTEKVVTIKDRESEDEPWASVIFVDSNNEVRVIRPSSTEMAQKELAILALGLDRFFS